MVADTVLSEAAAPVFIKKNHFKMVNQYVSVAFN
jgi:hypothetical protein